MRCRPSATGSGPPRSARWWTSGSDPAQRVHRDRPRSGLPLRAVDSCSADGVLPNPGVGSAGVGAGVFRDRSSGVTSTPAARAGQPYLATGGSCAVDCGPSRALPDPGNHRGGRPEPAHSSTPSTVPRYAIYPRLRRGQYRLDVGVAAGRLAASPRWLAAPAGSYPSHPWSRLRRRQ